MPSRSTFGYPGVTGRSLPDDGKMSKTRIDGRPYLCVAYDVERRTVQPLRLGAGLVVAPLIIYSASQLPPKKRRCAELRSRRALRLDTGPFGSGGKPIRRCKLNRPLDFSDRNSLQ